jgi:hypothetical protein
VQRPDQRCVELQQRFATSAHDEGLAAAGPNGGYRISQEPGAPVAAAKDASFAASARDRDADLVAPRRIGTIASDVLARLLRPLRRAAEAAWIDPPTDWHCCGPLTRFKLTVLDGDGCATAQQQQR